MQTTAQTYDAAHLDQMLAPIALYPDSLLGQVLVAATYPVQIVEATRWIDDPSNAGLQGENLTAALQQKNWDPSVKSLIAFPQLLHEMNDQVDWTDEVGQAFTMQEADTLNAVQRLRAEAQQAGNLESDNTKNVVVQDGSILIQPTDAHSIPVPVYGPSVYGTWPYADAEPYSFVTPSVYAVPQPPVIISTVFIQPYWGSMSYNWHDRRLEWNKGPSRSVVGGVGQEQELRTMHEEMGRGKEVNGQIVTPTMVQKTELGEPAVVQQRTEPLVAAKPFGQHLPANETPLDRGHDEQNTQSANGGAAPTTGTTVPLVH